MRLANAFCRYIEMANLLAQDQLLCIAVAGIGRSAPSDRL